MSPSRSSEDRTVHARIVTGTGVAEIVRYDRAGKWYVEPTWGKRTQLTMRDAALTAARWSEQVNGSVFYDRPGGSAFDRIARRAR